MYVGGRPSRGVLIGNRAVLIEFGIEGSGLNDGEAVGIKVANARVEWQEGSGIHSEPVREVGMGFRGKRGGSMIVLPAETGARLSGRPFTLRVDGYAYITKETKRFETPTGFGGFTLPDGSSCEGSSNPSTGNFQLNCLYALTPPPLRSYRLIHPDNPNMWPVTTSTFQTRMLWTLSGFHIEPLSPFGAMFELRRWENAKGGYVPHLDPAKLPDSRVAFYSTDTVAMFPIEVRIDGIRFDLARHRRIR
jgi:hypothetical protein